MYPIRSAAQALPTSCYYEKAEIHRRVQPDLSDESWRVSDNAFHRAPVDAVDNPVIPYQLSSAVDAMQPFMKMITIIARNRKTIMGPLSLIAEHLENKDSIKVADILVKLNDSSKILA